MTVDAGEPIVKLPDGRPVLVPTLGASFTLEMLTADDVPILEEVNAMVLDWIGPELRWTLNSSVTKLERFRPDDLDFVTLHPSQLQTPAQYEDPAQHEMEMLIEMNLHNELGMFCHSGKEGREGAPYSYRFYSRIRWMPPDPAYQPCATMRITVPVGWPLDDFRRRVCDIASKLRLRWGCAGYTYSGYAIDFYEEVNAGIYAHARRHVGYDTGFYVPHMAEWHLWLRSVNWLTFLGPSFVGELAKRKVLLASNDLVQVTGAGDNLVLQAGLAPQEGDINRLDVPRAYRRLDEMVRPLRASSDIDFYEPWTEQTTESWLRRFERRI
jgi:hypothetical protein